MSDDRPIGIFDSGVGGLSVFQEVTKLLPNEPVVYFADQANVPYGNKTESELQNLVENALNFFLKKNVKMVILACNTASVYTLEHLRAKFDIPIIGTVPVVKTLAENTKTGRVAILSTPATADSPYLAALINQFASDKHVVILGQTGLEKFVEEGDIDNPEIEKILNEHLSPLITSENIDAVALSCTHYPFLRERIEEVVGKNVKVYDSGGAIARHAKRILKQNKTLAKSLPSHEFYTTGEVEKFKSVAKIYVGELALVGKARI
ncbi:MAG TPA: glutamate racemase [Patescibacteria group bacterium]|nr:glutamate racemase [Patescibacteria group bacterium]